MEDLPHIFELYQMATDFQNKRSVVAWPNFEQELIKKEIKENRQWKMVINSEIACVWATAESDPYIWEEKNSDPAIYIHRISTKSNFRGRNLVKKIVEWCRKHAQEKNKKFIRMDTVGKNIGLINHYKKCGFEYLGLTKLNQTSDLPDHYHNATVSLFQISL